jgi:hypothetical protein
MTEQFGGSSPCRILAVAYFEARQSRLGAAVQSRKNLEADGRRAAWRGRLPAASPSWQYALMLKPLDDLSTAQATMPQQRSGDDRDLTAR